MIKLPKKIVDLIKDAKSVKVVATADEKGNPHIAFKDSLTVLKDGMLAFGEEFEGSQSNVNLVRSIWFDKQVEVTVRGKNGTAFQITGKPYRFAHAGPLFKEFYLAERKKRGPDSELAGVWLVSPEEVRDETYEIRKEEEDGKHPFFRHFDRASVRKIKSTPVRKKK